MSIRFEKELVTVEIPFIHGAEVRARRKHKPTQKNYRSRGFIQIRRIDRSQAAVAYSVDFGAEHTSDVLLHDGRLFWPANQTRPLPLPPIGNALEMLSDGRFDLFSDGLLATTPTFDDDLTIARIMKTEEESALNRIHRKVSACLVVGEELFSEGGVPIVFASSTELQPTLYVTTSGADRSAEPRTDGLAIQPAGAHLRAVHDALCRFPFRLPRADQSDNPEAGGYPHITVRHTPSVRAINIRVDAMFRILWEDIRRNPIDPKDEVGQLVYARFQSALDQRRADLTSARCDALQAVLMHLPDGFSHRARANLRDVLKVAAQAGETVAPREHRMREAAIEDEYIASIADLSGGVGNS